MYFCRTTNCELYSEADAWFCKQGKSCIGCHRCQCFSINRLGKMMTIRPAGKEISQENSEHFDKKYDQGKARFDLIDPRFEEEIAQILGFGAEKYSANSWQDVPDALNRYIAALRRHLNAIQQGEIIDPDSGLPHHAHMSCNAMFISHFIREMNQED